MKEKLRRVPAGLLVFILVFAWVFSGWPQFLGFPPKVQEAQAALPTYVAAGTFVKSAAAITPGLPAGIATNDILILFLETADQVISIANSNGGTWTEVTNSPQFTGNTRLTAFWSRYNGTQTAPTTTDSGNHNHGIILAVRGVKTSDPPYDITAGSIDVTSDTTGSIAGASTSVADTFVVLGMAIDGPDGN
ncbi:hypothetical protein IH781_03860, partial [Patescibacteria group bacterium]|nr:hypothetical protein [Patescibacteria group bacterium]